MFWDWFRWASCQLDTLRRCIPSSLRKALNELPTTLDDTYERALEGIPREKRQHAHRLFQCLVVAIRPLRVEELAEIFAIRFDSETGPNLSEGWRPQNHEEAVLSACSSLINITEDAGSKIVQFSHFSVKESLTSGRLLVSEVGSIRQYHIPLDAAHTILAQACLTVLLQLDQNVDKKCLATFPLAFYAARHWIDHAKFEDVAARVQDAMERLFNPQKPFLAAWAWICDVDRRRFQSSIDALLERPSSPKATALYYAALCGFSRLAKDYIVTRGEDVNTKCGYHGSPLHAASYEGHLEVADILLAHGADVNMGNNDGKTPLVAAYVRRNFDVMRLLLEHGAVADVEYDEYGPISHDAAYMGSANVIELLLRYKADVNARGSENWTPLHWASREGEVETVRLLLEHGADVNAFSETDGTPLRLASQDGFGDAVRVLLGYGADVHIRCRGDNPTALRVATSEGYGEIAQVLLDHGAKDD